MPKYIVDANILIQAHRKYYPMNVFCGFWNKMKHLADNNQIISIDIKDEVWPNGDELTHWCDRQLPNDFFVETAIFIDQYAHVIRAVSNSGKYTDNAISEFAKDTVADAFLIATAYSSVNDYVLVSEEIANPNGSKKVKIPDVCNMFGVRCINTVDMLRELGVTI